LQSSLFILLIILQFFTYKYIILEIPTAGNLLAQGQGLTVGRKLISYPSKRNLRLVSCVKTSEAPAIAKSDGELCSSNMCKYYLSAFYFWLGFFKFAATDEACLLDGNKQGSLEKNSLRNATFPNGFEVSVSL